MNYEPFLRRCETKYPNDESLGIVVSKAKEIFPDDDFRNNSKANELFYTTDKISKAQFFWIKKYVKELYDWLCEQGKVTPEQCEYVSSLTLEDVLSDEEIRSCYFRDLDGALDFVSAVGRRCGLDRADDLLMIKSIVILTWVGLDRSEIVEFRKSDLRDDNTISPAGLEAIKLSAGHFDLLKRFAELNVYRGFPTGKTQTYMQSPYLMRAARTPKLDEEKISQAVKRFNAVAIDKFGHRLTTKALRCNGQFFHIREEAGRDARTLTAVIRDVVGCDKHVAYWYKVMYLRWNRVFYQADAWEGK